MFETVEGDGQKVRDDSRDFTIFLGNPIIYRNTRISLNIESELNFMFILELVVKQLPTRLKRKWVKLSEIMNEEQENKLSDIIQLS